MTFQPGLVIFSPNTYKFVKDYEWSTTRVT